MKKIYLFAILILVVTHGWAQSFTASGPRTYYGTTTSVGTTLYFNFDKGKLVPNTDPWHISLAATAGSSTIAFNTGVVAQILSDTTFEKTITAPTAGYTATINNGLMSTNPGAFFYDLSGTVGNVHIITPRQGKLIVLKLLDGRYVKVEMLSLYKKAPINVQDSLYSSTNLSFGYYSFRYLVSEASSTNLSQKVTKISNLYVPAATDYQMVNLAIADTTLLAADRWNFKIQGRNVLPNTSGTISEFLNTAFNDVTSVSSITPASTLAWSTYDGPPSAPAPHTHAVYTKPGTTIVFKDSLGRYGKVVIESYYKDAPAVVCAQPTRYYTIKYYYNPYGEGETLTGRNGSALTTNEVLAVSAKATLTLSSSTLSVQDEGSASAEIFNVTSNDSWTASTTATWITLGNASGSGNGSFTISAAANTGALRTGNVDVTYCNGAKRTVAVSQEAITASLKDAMNNKVKIYPNPASDKFMVNLGNISCDAISITNMEGKQLLNITAPASEVEINTQQWNKGFYILKISTSEGTTYKKMEVQ